MKNLIALTLLLVAVTPARAQLVEPNQVGVRMGHVHLVVRDVEAHKRFFVDVLEAPSSRTALWS